MSLKRILKTVLWILVGLLFVLGIPALINCAYNYGANNTPIFITSWSAETTLSYYGNVLGAAITGASLFFTIRFTRKQIHRESFLKSETEKWAKIEETIGYILNEINPTSILKQDIDTGGTDPQVAIGLFQKYQMSCRIATDQLMTCVSTNDYKMISNLVERIISVADKLFDVSKKKVDLHMQQQQLQRRELALKLLRIEKERSGSLSAGEIAEYQNAVKETDALCLEEINGAMQPILGEFFHIYENEFRPLLRLKGRTFEVVFMGIQKNADAILSTRGK